MKEFRLLSVLNKIRVKESGELGDTIGMIRKLKYFLGMNTFCIIPLVKENGDTIFIIRELKSFSGMNLC